MNNTANLRRILNEIEQINKHAQDNSNMFKIDRVGDNLYHWTAEIYGPQNSLYDGFIFKLEIKLPETYPFAPPTAKFITPIKHVNINDNGNICLDILTNKWEPMCGIQSVLMSLVVLLDQPNPSDPLNSDLAELFRTNEKKYQKLIKSYCMKHATQIN